MSVPPSNLLEPAARHDEHELLAAARRGDTRAFERLYRALAPSVYGFCLRLARDSAEAQDCVQETFVRAWQRLGDFRGESRIGTWLHRIALNEVLGRRRHRAVEYRHLATVDTSMRRSHDDSATMQDLEEAIARLPERAKDVFVLRAIYGYTHEEIASMLGVTEGTSKSQLHRARKLLIASLPGDYADEGAGEDPLAGAAIEASE
ncbi:MAG TPA: sigma-70 family RNA polymerase sigma factor [Gammaproteobacteria bacterium]|nr:sigma-70 family RNA polymerase sigma factor [Gammaproteobacteria bacterium]